jgi:mRNA interferase MazF
MCHVDDAEPLRIRVPASGSLSQDSDLIIDQLRAIDNRRFLGGPLACLDEPLLATVEEAVREVLDMLHE